MAQRIVPNDEIDLIRRSQQGDRQAYTVLVDRYWDCLFRWLFHLSHDCHEAEDVTQEAFLRAFTALANFNPDGNFRAWLYRIGFNTFTNLHRARAQSRQLIEEAMPGREKNPAEVILSKEAMEHLTRAVGRLPTEFRGPFLLRVEEDLSFKEIAEVLGISEETARWRVFKARGKLMKILKPYLGDVGE